MPEVLNRIKMKTFCLILFSFFLFDTAFAQYQDIKGRAEKEFDNKNYSQAAYYYDQLATGRLTGQKKIPFYSHGRAPKDKISGEHTYICYQLAESYRLYQDYGKAEKWYDTVVSSKDAAAYPLAKLWFGVCLRANQRFDEAIMQLQQFTSNYNGERTYNDIAAKEIATCYFAKQQYIASLPVEVIKMPAPWNVDGGNYALTRSGTKFWFTSTRNNSQSLNHIYSANNSANPLMLSFDGNEGIKDMHYSTQSYDALHKRMYLAGWYKDRGKITAAIYCTTLGDSVWSALQKLNNIVNTDGSNSIQPFVTADGRHLYFASDRAGGQGAFDIWISNLDADGNPVDAVNAGKTINTPDDDEAPFYDKKSKRLVYSSKGLTGLGGFDFFESYNIDDVWSVPHNLGYPVNSSKDDLYYFADPDNDHQFYFSSDRESECCLTLFTLRYRSMTIAGNLSDCDSSKSISGVKVSLLDSISGRQVGVTTTGASGNYSFTAIATPVYKMVFEKTGYFTKSVFVSLSTRKDTLLTVNSCLKGYVIEKPITIKNILYDFDKATLRPESVKALDEIVGIMNDNPVIKIELSSHTDSVGSDTYNLVLSQNRAQSCVDYIISKGISVERITAKGYGKTRPLVPNSFPDGRDNPGNRQLNRRTEFTVLK